MLSHASPTMLWKYCAPAMAQVTAYPCSIRILEQIGYCRIMRIRRISVTNIGGLHDCELELPTQVLTAIAGPNGTGKSKLLACILAPWTINVPLPRNEEEAAEVRLSVSFTAHELDALERFDAQMDWNQGRPSRDTTVVVSRVQGSTSFKAEPRSLAVTEGLRSADFLRTCPTMDMVYLPAERRLNAHGGGAIDLSQLAEGRSASSTSEGRSQAASGVLDDNEFQSYARALCVAGSLPSENHSDTGQAIAQSRWDDFKRSIDILLHPKVLLPLTRENPDQLRIGLPGGGHHPVHALSSGERQALVIVSRVLRAGDNHSLVAIDEPDAYLHPSLSTKLLAALAPGTGSGGQMIVATHSPSILDSVEPGAIIRLSHDSPPAVVTDEEARLDLYREAGFKASSLTQSDILLVTEGTFDAEILPLFISTLGGAAIRPANGRSLVLRTLESLSGYDIPIVGVVDADIRAEAPSAHIASVCHVWNSADIEGVLLSDDAFMQAAIEGRLLKSEYSDLAKVKVLLESLLRGFRDASVAEMTMRNLREKTSVSWPSPRHPSVLEEMGKALAAVPSFSKEEIERQWKESEAAWNDNEIGAWQLVRGKWIIGKFVRMATEFRSPDAFIRAVAAHKPEIEEIQRLEKLVSEKMA